MKEVEFKEDEGASRGARREVCENPSLPWAWLRGYTSAAYSWERL